jgi:chromosome segregation ATPase
MKIQHILMPFLVALLVSCGSSQRVITADGSVYQVKGNKIMNAGTDVSETLSEDQKASIKTLVAEQKEAKATAEKLQEELEEKQDRLNDAIKEAQKKQEALIEKQEALDEKLEAKEEATADFLKAKKRLADKTKKYQRLKDKGKLSPRDDEKWQEKLKDYQQDIDDAQAKMDALNKD